MKTSLTLLAGLALIAVAGPAASQNAAWTAVVPPLKIIDNTYWVGSQDLAAILITTPRGHILLDVGLDENVALVKKNITALGFNPRDIRVLLNTHAHFDHSAGLARMKRDTGAQLVAMQGDVYALEKGVYQGSEDNAAFKAPPVKVDRVVVDGDTITLGGVTLTANHTPGHSPGCTTWTWPVRDGNRILTAGAFCSATVAANRITGNLQYPGIVEDYRATFRKAKNLKIDVFLAAHASFFDLAGKRARITARGPNPFIDPEGFQTLVANQERAFEQTLAQRSAAK